MKEKILGYKLKELRDLKGVTQTTVAQALNVGTSTYSNYETGARTPDIFQIYKLAGFFEISVEDLMHMIINIDNDEQFDAPSKTESSNELNSLVEYTSRPINKKRFQLLNSFEKELLCYFEKLSEADKKEIIEFTKIKARKKA